MAIVISQPDSLSLLKNLRRFEIASSADVRFQLLQGGIVIIDESYSPNSSGRVSVDISTVLTNYLTTLLPTSDIFLQSAVVKDFSVIINSSININFRVIKAGVNNLATNHALFLKANWLTWQPQTKKVTYSQPEWITYYAVENSSVKVKFYLKDGNSSIITLHSPSAGNCYSYNMQFAYIMSLAEGEKWGYYDLWVENSSGVRLTYVQRYIFQEENNSHEYFVFENSLGGLDTAVMAGASVLSPAVEHNVAELNEESVQIEGSISNSYRKDTGWLSSVEAAWIIDFFNSLSRYKLVSGVLQKIVLNESSIEDNSQEDMKSFSFVYRLSNDKGLLSLVRTLNDPPENLEITTPEGLFFLAPRLVDLQEAKLEDNILFPVQSPFLQAWKKLSWASVWSFLYDKILASAIGLMAHFHSNFSVLSELSEDEGKLKYKGESIAAEGGMSLQLGITSQTAHRGDRGNLAYLHSQNKSLHFDSLQQKETLASGAPVVVPGIVSGLFFSTTIPNIADTGYISIDISGFGRNTGNPFSWRGQTQITGGDFNTSAFRSVIIGQHLDVKICIHNAVVKVWVSGLGINANSNISSLAVNIRYGSDNVNVIDGYDDMALPESEVVSLRSFLSYSGEYLRSLSTAEQIRLVKAVVSADSNYYQIWSGTPAEYAEIQQKDPYTIYLVQ